MRARFIFSDCGEIGLKKVDCVLVNSNQDRGGNLSNTPLIFDIHCFHDGNEIASHKSIIVENGENYSLSDHGKLEPVSAERNLTYIVDVFRGDREDPSYFPQEHYIRYQAGQSFASLLYDQQPYFPAKKVFSPITILAPKVLINNDLNSYIVFNNATDLTKKEVQQRPLEISLLDDSGKEVFKKSYHLKFNSTFIFDVKKETGLSSEEIKLLNFTARGGASLYSIYTMIKNERSQSLAIEHSLPPMYYVDGNLGQVRKQFLNDHFTEASIS